MKETITYKAEASSKKQVKKCQIFSYVVQGDFFQVGESIKASNFYSDS